MASLPRRDDDLLRQIRDLQERLERTAQAERRERQRADMLERAARQAWKTAIVPRMKDAAP